NVNDTILYLQQLHINLDDIEIQKVSIVDSYFNNKKQRGSNYDTKLLENRI
ncbi:TPA: ABC transporter ATP-binding protein, partial [Staphylococcus aureus]|nr:ABC transporter ATP-binding protein [Staphylococcus aureus]HCX9827246.1 ABC transporter ATP-binding protein [Staphylococcus aureus]HCY0380648.1 ABC transporter ATP-binding protein [Staphylococcus aureus]